MPTKLKPSTKEYKRDRNNRMTNQWIWKHFTVSGTSTEELKKLYESPSYRRKKSVIKRELERAVKKNIWIDTERLGASNNSSSMFEQMALAIKDAQDGIWSTDLYKK